MVWVSEATVDLHLRALGLSDQQSCYRAFGRGPAKIKRFVEIEFKYFQKLVQELNADIAFEDESCIGCGNHSGQTWGLVGQPPEIKACDESNRSDPPPQALLSQGGRESHETRACSAPSLCGRGLEGGGERLLMKNVVIMSYQWLRRGELMFDVETEKLVSSVYIDSLKKVICNRSHCR